MDTSDAIPATAIPKYSLPSKSSSPTPQFTEDGLILPRKLMNPFADTKEKKNLQRELLFNQKIGKNVLDQKSELEKVMAKRAKDARAKEKAAACDAEKEKSNSLERKSSFEKKLAEQAAKLAKSTLNDDKNQLSDANQDDDHVHDKNFDNLPEGQAEFLKIHAKIKSHISTSSSSASNSASPSVGVSTADKDADKKMMKIVTSGQENKSANISNNNNNNPKGL